MQILVINGHDYSKYIKDEGYIWSRDDLDSEKTTRVKSGNLRRDKITEKRNLSFKMRDMPESLAAQLDTDLLQATFSVKYHDLHGDMTRTFYCSQFPANLRQVIDEGNLMWSGISFNIHEV
jgi:hypothetical protein